MTWGVTADTPTLESHGDLETVLVVWYVSRRLVFVSGGKEVRRMASKEQTDFRPGTQGPGGGSRH